MRTLQLTQKFKKYYLLDHMKSVKTTNRTKTSFRTLENDTLTPSRNNKPLCQGMFALTSFSEIKLKKYGLNKALNDFEVLK